MNVNDSMRVANGIILYYWLRQWLDIGFDKSFTISKDFDGMAAAICYYVRNVSKTAC